MAQLADRIAAPVLDALTLLAAWLALPALAAQLGRESEANLALLIGAHLLMCVGIAASKLIQPVLKGAPATMEPDAGGPSAGQAVCATQATLLGLSLPFSIALFAMLFAAGSLLDETSFGGAWLALAGGDGNTGITLAATLAFLLLMSAFPSAVLYSPKARLRRGTPAYWAVRTGSLLAVNTMVLVTAAFWQGYLAGSEPLNAGIPLRIVLTVILFPLFLLFYAAPRLALLSLEPGRWTLAGFLIMLVLYVWRLTA